VPTQATAATDLGIPQGKWIVDPAESRIAFAIKGMWGLVRVRGQFDGFDGTLTVGPDGVAGTLKIEADTLDTANRKRDEHLRSADFFDTARHPEIIFTTTSARVQADELIIAGDLVLGDTRTALELGAEHSLDRGRIQLRTRLVADRTELGLAWNKLGMVRSETIIDVDLELVPAPA
jgi:polyisoprenoid-binding protein YceI